MHPGELGAELRALDDLLRPRQLHPYDAARLDGDREDGAGRVEGGQLDATASG